MIWRRAAPSLVTVGALLLALGALVDLAEGDPVSAAWLICYAALLDVLDGLGMRRRVIEEDGSWVDLTARAGGLHGVHRSEEVGAELSFELTGDVSVLQEELAAAGVEALLHEEAFGRSLRITDPDGGSPVWVVERQPDLYSYALSEM